MALTKARLSGLVVVTTLAGYWLGTDRGGDFDGWRLAHTLLGTTLCAFGSAVFNQLIEIEPDARMARTASRPLPGRRIPATAAFMIGVVLSGWGVVHLVNMVNVEAAALAAATLITYLFIYTPLKQRSTTNTLVGAVSGALPPVIGWAAAAGPETTALGFRWEWLNRAESWWLFALLFFWQLPHFLAINWMYRDDYRRAGFVMWSNDDESGALTSLLALIFSLCRMVGGGSGGRVDRVAPLAGGEIPPRSHPAVGASSVFCHSRLSADRLDSGSCRFTSRLIRASS